MISALGDWWNEGGDEQEQAMPRQELQTQENSSICNGTTSCYAHTTSRDTASLTWADSSAVSPSDQSPLH